MCDRMNEKKTAAVVLAGGKGKRMNAGVPKQYLVLEGKPVLFYALDAFEKSPVDQIILVTGENEEEYCRNEIVEKYGFCKVTHIVCGGKERYHSVFNGLQCVTEADYVLIHDGARPFVTQKMIRESIEMAEKYSACVCAVPVKDTIKAADEAGFARETLDRSTLWTIQTPQTFSLELICGAYEQLMQEEDASVTDDAMVVEKMTDVKVRLIEGSYNNIKITTPEDLAFAKTILNL